MNQTIKLVVAAIGSAGCYLYLSKKKKEAKKEEVEAIVNWAKKVGEGRAEAFRAIRSTNREESKQHNENTALNEVDERNENK